MNDGDTLSPPERADLTAWIAVVGSSIGTFMALLDISIVNASLPTIQGEIGASGTEGTWVTTSYLVAESIAIPLTGWLTRMLGLRTLFVSAIILFTAFSMFCGFAHNLTLMIVGRAAQGLTGGLMLPIVMIVIAGRLPIRQQTIGYAIFGTTTVAGPVIGPVLGGWLTEAISWRYAFFINLPIGMLLVAMMYLSLPPQRARPQDLFKADWLGVIGLALGLGCLTVVLEEGQREQWFESSQIIWLTLTATMGFILLLIGQRLSRTPVIRLALLLRWQFGLVAFLGVFGGIVFYGIMFLVPQFLAAIAGYNAFESGKVLLVSAMTSIVLMPFVPVLVRLVPARIAVCSGMLTLSLSCWINAGLTTESASPDFILPQFLIGLGTMFMMTWLTQLAVSTVPLDQTSDSSSMFNTARNIGGSFGLASIATLQDQRFTVHTRHLEEALPANSTIVQDFIGGFGQIAGGPEQALRLLSGMIDRQALVMTYNDLFIIVAIALLVTAPLALFIPPLPQGSPQPVH